MSDSNQPNQTEVAASSIDIKDLPDGEKNLGKDAESVKGGGLPEKIPGHSIPIPSAG